MATRTAVGILNRFIIAIMERVRFLDTKLRTKGVLHGSEKEALR